MSETSQSVLLELFSEEADAAETERLTRALRRELLDLREVDDVAPASAGPPHRAPAVSTSPLWAPWS